MHEGSRISLLSQLEQALQEDKPALVLQAATPLLQDEVSRDVVAPVVLAYDLLKTINKAYSAHRTGLAIMVGLRARDIPLPASSRHELVRLLGIGFEGVAYNMANQIIDDDKTLSMVERLSDPAVKSYLTGSVDPQAQFFSLLVNFSEVYVDGIHVMATKYTKTTALAIDAFVCGATMIPDTDFRFPTILSRDRLHGHRNVPDHSYLTDIGKLAVAAHAEQLRKKGFGQDQLSDEKTGLPGYLHNEVKRYLRGEAGSLELRAKIAHAFMLLAGELQEQEFMRMDWISYNIPKYFAGYLHSASLKGSLTQEKRDHLKRVFAHAFSVHGYKTTSDIRNPFTEAFEDKLRTHIETAYSIALIGSSTSSGTMRQFQAIDNMLSVAKDLLPRNPLLNRTIQNDTKIRFQYWASQGNQTAQRVCDFLCLPYNS